MHLLQAIGALATASALGTAVAGAGHRVPVETTDVLVYGATPSGIAAAIEAAHLGKHVTLLAAGQHVGGMSSSGLSVADYYDRRAIGGLAQTFFATVAASYGSTDSQQGTIYEPHVAEQAFQQMLAGQRRVKVVLSAPLSSVVLSGHSITDLFAGNGVDYRASEFVDASYEGDLLAAAGVSFATGRESQQAYGESLAGVNAPMLVRGVYVDPYVIPGDASSGLLPHIESTPLAPPGSADSGVMGYGYRLCISLDPADQIPLTAPPGYDPAQYEVVGRFAVALAASGAQPNDGDYVGPLTEVGSKRDLDDSAFALVSTNDVGINSGYALATPAQRQQLAQQHALYLRGLLYFVRTDPRIPLSVRNSVGLMGLCKDEFTDNGGWPWLLYVREARRLVGAYVMTQADIQQPSQFSDAVGVGGYAVDSHVVHRVAIGGAVYDEGQAYTPLPSLYQIPYRVLTPRLSEIGNLLVSVDVSASHVAFDSLRVEATYMILGQAAGAAAALAIDERAAVQVIDTSALAKRLQADGQVITLP